MITITVESVEAKIISHSNDILVPDAISIPSTHKVICMDGSVTIAVDPIVEPI
jgi:hypothetical protein